MRVEIPAVRQVIGAGERPQVVVGAAVHRRVPTRRAPGPAERTPPDTVKPGLRPRRPERGSRRQSGSGRCRDRHVLEGTGRRRWGIRGSVKK